MFCTNCGKNIPDNAAFCTECGAKLDKPEGGAPAAAPAQAASAEAAAVVEKAKKGFGGILKNKAVIYGACGVVVLAVLIAAIAGIASSAGSSFKLKSAQYFGEIVDEKIVLFYGDKKIEADTEASSMNLYSAVDGSAVFVYTSDDELFHSSKGGELEMVAEEVDIIIASANGNAAAYISDEELFLYKDGKTSSVADIENYGGIVISPDGSALAYAEYNDDWELECYAYNGKSVEEIGEYSPVSISNGGSVLYMIKSDNNKLYVAENLKGDDAESVKTINTSYNYYLSSDYKTIMFYDDGKTYVYSPSLKEAVKVNGSSVSVLFPTDAVSSLDSFDNFVGYSDGSTYRFKRSGDEYEKFKIASSSGLLSADGKTLLYSDGDELCKISTTKDGAEEVELADEFEYFCGASSDLKHIYYINEDGELMYNPGREDKSEKISDDVSSAYAVVTADGVCTYIYDMSGNEGSLYYSVKGGKKTKADGLSDANYVYRYSNIIRADYDDAIFISKDGKKFEKTGIEY